MIKGHSKMRSTAGLLIRTGRAAIVALSVVLIAGAAPVAAQTPTLAELAKKEAERRKAQKPAGKVYTNKDLPESAKKDPASAAQAPGAPAAPVAGAAPAGPEPAAATSGEQKDEKYWRDRIAQAREELRRNEAFAEALQSRINALTRDFSSRDNPVQRARVADDRERALAEQARVKVEIENGRKKVDDIEEEARRAGVPAGWLR
jgi:hypothetical protein